MNRTIPAEEIEPGMRIRLEGFRYAIVNRYPHTVHAVRRVGQKIRIEAVGYYGTPSTTELPPGQAVEVCDPYW